MGKKGGWFSVVKKALNPADTKDKDQMKNPKSKKYSAKEKNPPPLSEEEETVNPPPQTVEETNSNEVIENDLDKNDALQTSENEEVTAPESGLLKYMSCYPGKSMEEIAAIRIQVVFKGFLARREIRALRGLERLKSLIEGQSVKRQSSTTLKCMQNLAHLQSQIRARRIRMSEENQALHRQLQLKHEKDLEKLRMGKEWDVSMQSKEKIESNLQSKQEAAMRRERALAYSFSHQTKKNTRSVNPSFMDPNNPHWGWSWLERWMASRPWETRSTGVVDNNDYASVKSAVSRAVSLTGERKDKPAAQILTGQKLTRPLNRQSLSTGPTSNPLGRSSAKAGGSKNTTNEGTRSAQSRPQRRHSVGGTPVGDDESLGSSSPIPSYMTSTKSTKARSKPASPLGVGDKTGASVKKRLSFPTAAAPSASAGIRRHSVPGKIESSSEMSGLTQAHYLNIELSSKRGSAVLSLAKHDVFSFIDFRSKIVASARIWMIGNHHSPMSFLNLVSSCTLPIQMIKFSLGGLALNACQAWMPYLPARAAVATAIPAKNGVA
ncbi:hypothetical protein V2J09_019770 [Rumex salicifolius]